MKKSGRAIAVMICVAMLACACSASEQEEEKHVYAEEEEKPYQAKLDMIEPSAYNNVDGLQLETGTYISIIGKAKDGQYWSEVKAGVEQAAADLNEYLGYEGKDKVKVTYSAPDEAGNVDEQVNILDEELARYPDAVGIAIADVNACEVQFDLAAEGDIPIVAFDSGSDYQGLMAMVSADNQAAAREAADAMAEAMGGSGEVLLFVHDSKSSSALGRERAFQEEIQNNHPDITVVEAYHMDQLSEMQQIVADEINAGTYQRSRDAAGTVEENSAEKNVAEETTEGTSGAGTVTTEEITAEEITEEDVIDYLFAKHPDIKGCFCTNSTAVNYALVGLRRAEIPDAAVVGFDAEEEEIDGLRSGDITGLIVQNPFGMGYAAVVASARAALKMGNEAFVNTGYTWVTKENLEEESVQKILYDDTRVK